MLRSRHSRDMGKPVFFYGCSRSRSPRRPRSQPLYLPAICWSGAMPSRDASLILASVQRFSLPRLPTTISWASRKASHRFLTLMLSQPSSSSIPAVSTSSYHPSSNQEWTRALPRSSTACAIRSCPPSLESWAGLPDRRSWQIA
jgi:hypothetical protein